jgi:UDP-N-acetylmuramoyl-L-alanyl-D-glutamate--2,6-diaminopimelate ligase
MEAYFASKRAMFRQAERAVVNVGDEFGRRLAAELPQAVTFDAGSDALDGIELKLRGSFNRENAIGAALAAHELDVPVDAIRRGIESVSGVPGRFESIDEGQPFAVIVDYAHTPDSLENVLRTARELSEGQLIVVFGAGGDRDRAKRPLMGRVAAELADRALLTSDNPRSEDPAAIRAAVLAGALGVPDRGEVVEVAGRRSAIVEAVRRARPGDAVVVAGKGHEQGQEIGGVVHPFDDRAVLRAALEELTGSVGR